MIFSHWIGKFSNPLLLESFKVELMPVQENQVHSGQWAETLVWLVQFMLTKLVATCEFVTLAPELTHASQTWLGLVAKLLSNYLLTS